MILAYNKVSVKQVIATVTMTVTKTVHHHGRRAKTVLVEPTSADYDGTTTIRMPKATPAYVSPEIVDAPAGTVTSYKDYNIGTTTITSSEPSPTTTVTVTFTSYNDYYTGTTTVTASGTDTVTIPEIVDAPASTVTVTSYNDYYVGTTTITIGEPSSTTKMTVTASGSDMVTISGPIVTTTTVYAKRNIAAAQGGKDKNDRFSSWTKLWLPADMASVAPGPNDPVTVTPAPVTVTIFAPVIPVNVTQAFNKIADHAAIPPTIGVLSKTRTVTLHDLYPYTGPTGVPMKTVTLRG